MLELDYLLSMSHAKNVFKSIVNLSVIIILYHYVVFVEKTYKLCIFLFLRPNIGSFFESDSKHF